MRQLLKQYKNLNLYPVTTLDLPDPKFGYQCTYGDHSWLDVYDADYNSVDLYDEKNHQIRQSAFEYGNLCKEQIGVNEKLFDQIKDILEQQYRYSPLISVKAGSEFP